MYFPTYGFQSKDKDTVSDIRTRAYTLKTIGFLRNPRKMFRRLENVSKCVKMLKKRIFNSTEPLKVLRADTREEPSTTKPFLKFRIAKKGFVKQIQNL